MKKLLLATALAAVSLTSVSAEPANPAGKGFYLIWQVGLGGVNLSVEDGDKIYMLKDSKYELSEKKEELAFLPGTQLVWGYTHRFDNNLTLGAEASYISPAVRIGYMIADQHQISVSAHYALTANLMIQLQYNREKTDTLGMKVELDGLSGVGGGVCYEYFTPSKTVIRLGLDATYYSGTGSITGSGRIKSGGLDFYPLVDGKATAWEISGVVGIGSQW